MRQFILALCILFQAGLFSTHADIFVVPSALANLEGNSGFFDPFLPYRSPITGEYDPSRFQQVYAASEFASFIPDGGWIYGMHFRGNTPSGGIPPGGIQADLPDIQINFSTISRPPEGLSPIFAENLGANDAIVFGRGPLNNFDIGTPMVFTADIFFTTPFFYNPNAGNLLMDVRTYAGIPAFYNPGPSPRSIPAMDAHEVLGDSVSSVLGSLSSDSGSLSTRGLVTMFIIIPIPEPSTISFFALCFAALIFSVWRRTRNNPPSSDARNVNHGRTNATH